MIVGIDVSSKRVDLAWLENGKPCRWHQELAKGHLIDRLRSIEVRWPRNLPRIEAITGDTMTVTGPYADVTDIAIEYPFAVQKPAVAALMATVGVITRQAPSWARVAWPSSGELRTAIGAKNTKQHAVVALHNVICGGTLYPCLIRDWDEHELDALVACIGWGRILAAQDAE